MPPLLTTTTANTVPKSLHVFYDVHCGICLKCRQWLEKQPTYFPLHFLSWNSPEAHALCPPIESLEPWKEIVVMTDDKRIYQGAAAWVMCLYATISYRQLALHLAQPALLPFARQICHLVSRNRYRLSSLLKLSPAQARHLPPATSACPLPTNPHHPASPSQDHP